ncbi:hypothetical protein ACFVJI_32030 [Streptomyces sp. NPDC127584]|uniref:hypothetical protein n=1 Tax=Streptomyces sp. NPDC127584 TaxID=3345403 RepID=UPI00363D9052
MTSRVWTSLGITTTVLGAGLAAAAPASAGGIGDFLSPAFSTSCSNLNNAAHAHGKTTKGTGSIGGNLASLPLYSALNQCGGADSATQYLSNMVKNRANVENQNTNDLEVAYPRRTPAA